MHQLGHSLCPNKPIACHPTWQQGLCPHYQEGADRHRADLKMEGTALLTAEAEAATKEDEEALRKLAKSRARAAKRKLANRLPPWPPRVLRWRGPGRD